MVAAGLIQAGAQPAGAQPKFLVAKQVQSPVGFLHTGDLVVFRQEGGSAHAAFVQLFVQIPAGAQPTKQIYLIGLLLKTVGGCRLSKAARDVQFTCVPASAIVGVFPYLAEDDVVYIVASGDAF